MNAIATNAATKIAGFQTMGHLMAIHKVFEFSASFTPQAHFLEPTPSCLADIHFLASTEMCLQRSVVAATICHGLTLDSFSKIRRCECCHCYSIFVVVGAFLPFFFKASFLSSSGSINLVHYGNAQPLQNRALSTSALLAKATQLTVNIPSKIFRCLLFGYYS